MAEIPLVRFVNFTVKGGTWNLIFGTTASGIKRDSNLVAALSTCWAFFSTSADTDIKLFTVCRMFSPICEIHIQSPLFQNDKIC